MFLNKRILLLSFLGLTLMWSCDNDFEEINTDPDRPEAAPTYTIFNTATKRLMDETRDGWVSGRMVLPWMQYSAQRNYVDEDKYQYRPTTGDQAWNNIYRALANYKEIITFCEDPELGLQMAAYGDLNNQIGVARIMMAYAFLDLTNYFGDVPYWSVSERDNPDFQALQIDTYPQPKYVSQETIFKNLLVELDQAVNQLTSGSVFVEPGGVSGDKIYEGDVELWKKFGNSLRLRIANMVKHKIPAEANAAIANALSSGVFTSNQDNAALHYMNTATGGSPFWAEFFVGGRNDFFVNNQLINLLQGETGNFGVDPRLQKYAAPFGTSRNDVGAGAYEDSNDPNDYQGMPYALPADRMTANNALAKLSPFSKHVLTATFPEVLMEYSEVEFILSELNGWAQSHYENGVIASMEKWGVDPDQITTFVSNLPAADQENVITQKYVAMYMQPQVSWADYRRTGFPTSPILLLPGDTGYELDGTPYVFTPHVSGMSDMPYRISYPVAEQSVNNANWNAAATQYTGDSQSIDAINAKLWWMP